MYKNINFYLVIIMIFLFGCNESKVASPPKLISEHLVKFDGIWLSDGYGYAIEQIGDKFAFYHVTPDICVAADVTDSTLADVFDLYRFGQSENTIFLSTLTEPNEYVFHRSKNLPVACTPITLSTTDGTIDAVISFMATHYAFFDVRGVDWTAASQRLLSTKGNIHSDSDLYDIIRHELEPLNDAHVELVAYIDGDTLKFDADPGIIRETLIKSANVENISYREKRTQFNQDLWITGIGEITLLGKGQSAGNDRIRFGMATNSIGYLAIKSMGGFIDLSSTEPLTEAETFSAALDDAINLFNKENAQTVIIDLSINSGGYDYISRLLAERFASKPVLAYSFYAGDSQGKHEFEHTIIPSSRPRFEGKVFVLTSRASVSAAELAIMCLDAIDNVQIAGEPTRGALSTKLAKLLPNGWELMLSNQVYFDHNGQMVEKVGIIPDVTFDVFIDDNLAKNHLAAVKHLVALIQSQPKK